MMNDFGLILFADFKLKFKILILVFSNLNSNMKLANFSITVTYC